MGDEDQLTEMLAFLWQESPRAFETWLMEMDLPADVTAIGVETQFVLPSGKRPDIAIRSEHGTTLVESKLGAGFGDTQIPDYLHYLGECSGCRSLLLLTQKPEIPPVEYLILARELEVDLKSKRWQDMADCLGGAGEETLVGDFIQLLIREGLVKPNPLGAPDWEAWNAGYNVELRLDALLAELDPRVARMLPSAKGRSGSSKLWTWRVWSTGSVDIGLGFLAAEWTDRPHTHPVVHCWVLNRDAGDEAKLQAVNASPGRPSEWIESSQLRGALGLSQFGPAIARPADAVLHGETFDEQVDEASDFIRETLEHFRARGYLPAS